MGFRNEILHNNRRKKLIYRLKTNRYESGNKTKSIGASIGL